LGGICLKIPKFWPEISLGKSTYIFTKATFWAQFGQNRALFSARRLVTLRLTNQASFRRHESE
jgi:hypothetical protein